VRLDIGCGTYKHEGYTGVDVEPSVNPDICAPMWNIPLPDNSVDEIISSHALEHVTKFQVVPVLLEWKRLIKTAPDGIIIIQVPDLEWCCRAWLAHPQTDWWMDILFGMCTTEGEQHRTGFTVPIMTEYLRQAGLSLIDARTIESHGQPTLEFVAMKAATA
jgi:predicted SAM-dependent methyltransferase